jgi:ATP-dependent RNA helicase DDX49/DBP8
MITSKRRAPTIDDLLRRQEEPLKRYRSSTPFQEHDHEGSSVDERHDEGSSEESSEDSEPDCTQLESGGEESTDSEFSQETPPVNSGRFSRPDDLLGSRVSIKPKIASQRSQGASSGAGSSKNVTFLSLNISPPLLSALSKMAIHNPTEIQRACIPPLLIGLNIHTIVSWLLLTICSLEGRDCIGNAKTGSGKTIAFALPILQRLSVDPYGIFALVLTPTRYCLVPLLLEPTVLTIIGSSHSKYRNNLWCWVRLSIFELP